MYIPDKYKLEDGKTPADGEVEVTCKICGQKFAVPSSEVDGLGPMPVCENQACKEAYEKAQADVAAAQAKNNKSGDSLTEKATKI